MSKKITVRNLLFKTDAAGTRKSFEIDPIGVAFFAALSSSLPNFQSKFPPI
jgi:hypothetical protein